MSGAGVQPNRASAKGEAIARGSKVLSDLANRLGPTARIWIILAALFLILSVASPRFAARGNLGNILQQGSLLGLVAVGQTLLMISGAIDLSVGATMTVAEVLSALLIAGNSSRTIPVALLMLAVGGAIGLINGLLVTLRRIDPFIVTLGMGIVIKGALEVYTHGYTMGGISEELRYVATQSIGPVPILGIIFIGIAVLVWAFVASTTFGRRVYAVGANYETSRLSGSPSQDHQDSGLRDLRPPRGYGRHSLCGICRPGNDVRRNWVRTGLYCCCGGGRDGLPWRTRQRPGRNRGRDPSADDLQHIHHAWIPVPQHSDRQGVDHSRSRRFEQPQWSTIALHFKKEVRSKERIGLGISTKSW